MGTILFTGVTGQVGSSVASLLQEGDHKVLYLIRPNGEKNAITRLSEVLPDLRETDIAISGDVTLPYAGISELDRKKWKGQIDKIVHGAASIKFDEALAEETWHINVHGTSNMLSLAEELGVQEFHFLSTVYVAGSARAFAETDFDVDQTARNIYESSKREAERLIRKWSGGKFSIYRLSIAIGNSKTGATQAFNGYYGFLIPFWRLLQTLRQRWETEPEECLKNGISFDADGFLELPLSIDCSKTSTLNIITIDWVSKVLVDLFELPSANQIYHLVNPAPIRVQWAIETSLRHLGMGVQYGDGENLEFPERSLLRTLQKGLNRGINRFRPYITHEPILACEQLRRTLKEHYVPPPIVDEALLVKMLDYAKLVNFGQKIHQPI